MRVALVHDDLVQWGGAERVLLGLCEMYPEAPIYTSVFDSTNFALKRNFGTREIVTSFLQKIPGRRSLYRTLLPFYPIAFEQFNFDKYDLVISNTTRFAKSIITKPKTVHISYCHTPPRFLWHFSGEKNYGILETLMTKLRLYDQVSSRRVDFFFAGSKNAAGRIKKIYRRESKLIYPFIDLNRFKGIDIFNGGYFVVAGRPNGYKRFDIAIKACKKIGAELKIISGGLDDKMVVRVLAGCRALIVPGIEDFGLISLEAQALGKRIIAYKAGGALETVIPGKTGFFFSEQTEDSLAEVLENLDYSDIQTRQTDCLQNAGVFSKENFIRNFKKEVDSLVY